MIGYKCYEGFIWNGSEGKKWKWERKQDEGALGVFLFPFFALASAVSLSFLVVMMESGGVMASCS